MVGLGLKEALDELYGVTPDEFIAKRKELVAALKALPDPETASAVAQARKPTMAAWIVNSLSLQDPTVAEQLPGWAIGCGPPRKPSTPTSSARCRPSGTGSCPRSAAGH